VLMISWASRDKSSACRRDRLHLGMLESLSTCEFETIGIVIVSSA